MHWIDPTIDSGVPGTTMLSVPSGVAPVVAAIRM